MNCGCTFDVDQKKMVKPIEWYKENGKRPPLKIDWHNLPDCKLVWNMLGEGRSLGVFQLETSLGRTYAKKLKPESIEHLAALGSILRPGCLEDKSIGGISVTDHYCLRKNGLEEHSPPHESLKPILDSSYSLIIFQEQILSIAQILAGFSLSESDTLRKGVAKKIPEVVAQCRVMFTEGCKKIGKVSEAKAKEIFDGIEKSQRYLFNRCISGREIIRKDIKGRFCKSLGYSIEEMYNIRNSLEYAKKTGHEVLRRKWMRLKNFGKGYSLCDDGRLRPNTIVDIQFAGIRQTYKVILEDGRSCSVTNNHKFPTNVGELTVSEICEKIKQEEILLYICGEYEICENKYNYSNFSKEERLNKKNGLSGRNTGGFNNRWYTNGSYTDYLKCNEILPMKCNNCGIENVRLELHHKDKDRTNSKIENIERLCVSCHKKADYALGRVKRGEKGFPHRTMKIIDIVPDRIENTYDVTMEGPNHNYVLAGSNIVTKNSHAYGYAINGVRSAFFKAHFPTEFFCAYLRNAHEKMKPYEEIAELINEAKIFGISVVSPDIRALKKHFHLVDEKTIRYGIVDIRGIGNSHFEKLKELEKLSVSLYGKPLGELTWNQFLPISLNLNKTTVENLIQSGALACYESTN